MLEGFRDKQLPITATFIDFKKAFDSIEREFMFAILRSYGIPDAIVKAIRVLYDNSSSAVMADGGTFNTFPITTGVLQGDVLAPYLFVVVIDYLLTSALAQCQSGLITHPRLSRWYPETITSDLDFCR